MYYHVATPVGTTSTWRWKSTVLSSLDTLFQFLRLFRTLPHDQLRVFSSSSREGLAERLEQENKSLASTLVTAAQFLQERMILPPAAVRSTSACEGGASLERGSIAVLSQQAVNEHDAGGGTSESRAISYLERRRQELESGPGGNHDLPYRFSLPLSMPQVFSWLTLLRRVQQGELLP